MLHFQLKLQQAAHNKQRSNDLVWTEALVAVCKPNVTGSEQQLRAELVESVVFIKFAHTTTTAVEHTCISHDGDSGDDGWASWRRATGMLVRRGVYVGNQNKPNGCGCVGGGCMCVLCDSTNSGIPQKRGTRGGWRTILITILFKNFIPPLNLKLIDINEQLSLIYFFLFVASLNF